jgi:hypothetical protein
MLSVRGFKIAICVVAFHSRMDAASGDEYPDWTEAASGGFYASPWGSHPKLQIVSTTRLAAHEGA